MSVSAPTSSQRAKILYFSARHNLETTIETNEQYIRLLLDANPQFHYNNNNNNTQVMSSSVALQQQNHDRSAERRCASQSVRKSAVAVAVCQKIGYWNWRPSIYHIHMWPCRHFAIWRRLRVRLRHHRHCRATHGSNQLYLHTTVQNVAATNSKQNCR